MQVRFCSKCGNTIKDGDKFCRKCGTPVRMPSAAPPAASPVSKPHPNIPSYDEIKERFNAPNNKVYVPEENTDGTVLLWGANDAGFDKGSDIKANLPLTLEELLRGCRKVVDFGTGKRYEIIIPAGLSPGDKVIVKNTGISGNNTAGICNIELTLQIG